MNASSLSVEQAAVLASDPRAMLYSGLLIRVVDESDDDCGRDAVELYENGRWQTCVIASLDWMREMDEFLTGKRVAA